MFPHERRRRDGGVQGCRDRLGHATRAAVFVVSVAGGLSVDSDTFLAGAAHQVGPLVMAMEPADTARLHTVLMTRAVQVSLFVAGGAVIMRVIASAAHGIVHWDRPDTALMLGLSAFITVFAVLAELAAVTLTGRGRNWGSWIGIFIAMLPFAVAVIALHSSFAIDAYTGLFMILLLPLRWMVPSQG